MNSKILLVVFIFLSCSNTAERNTALDTSGIGSEFLAKQSIADTDKKFSVLYNNDLVNITHGDESWIVASQDKFSNQEIEDRIRRSVAETKDTDIDIHFFRPGFGHIPFWKSEVYSAEEHYLNWQEETGNELSAWGAYMVDDKYGDMLTVFIDEIRKTNQKAFVSFLMNDRHYEMYGEIKAISKPRIEWPNETEWISNDIIQNPDLRIKPDNSPTVLDWSNEAYRNKKLALISEIIANYDIDGIELDFMRFPLLFPDSVTVERRINITSSFIKSVRKYLDKKGLESSSNSNIQLSIRVPVHLNDWKELGLDYTLLDSIGVDMVIVSSYFFSMQQGIDYKSIRASLDNVDLYFELNYLTWQQAYGHNNIVKRLQTQKAQYLTTAFLAKEEGFDGVSFFNFQYHKKQFSDILSFEVVNKVKEIDKNDFDNEWYFRSSFWKDEKLPFRFSNLSSHIFVDTVNQIQKELPFTESGIFRFIYTSEDTLWFNVYIDDEKLIEMKDCNLSYNSKIKIEDYIQENCYKFESLDFKNERSTIKVELERKSTKQIADLVYYELIFGEGT